MKDYTLHELSLIEEYVTDVHGNTVQDILDNIANDKNKILEKSLEEKYKNKFIHITYAEGENEAYMYVVRISVAGEKVRQIKLYSDYFIYHRIKDLTWMFGKRDGTNDPQLVCTGMSDCFRMDMDKSDKQRIDIISERDFEDIIMDKMIGRKNKSAE